ncbi:MAG: energy transducer TonB [Terriglobales bacterium]
MKRFHLTILIAGFAVLAGAQGPPLPPGPLLVSPGSLTPIKTPHVEYPLEAARNGVQGSVSVRFTISAAGDVEAVEVLSGEPVLAKAVVSTVKKWKYKPYEVDGAPVPVRTEKRFDFSSKERTRDLKDNAPSTALAPDTPAGESSASVDNLPKRVRVSPSVSRGMLLHQVSPIYPPDARKRHIQGSVVLHAVIGKDGLLKDLKPLSGSPELIPAAVGAVQQWRYRPYYLNSEPVEVETVITVNFKLGP